MSVRKRMIQVKARIVRRRVAYPMIRPGVYVGRVRMSWLIAKILVPSGRRSMSLHMRRGRAVTLHMRRRRAASALWSMRGNVPSSNFTVAAAMWLAPSSAVLLCCCQESEAQ
jgi:hypothetical protein